MKEIIPPKSNFLVKRYKKPCSLRFFDRYYIPPRGYSLVVVSQHNKSITSLYHMGGKITSSDFLYLIKMDFDITWGVGKLNCTMENDVQSFDFGLSGSASFEVNHPADFFIKMNVGNVQKIYVDDFKNIWLRIWSDLLKKTFYENKVAYNQVHNVVDTLKSTIDHELSENYSINVTKISIKETTELN